MASDLPGCADSNVASHFLDRRSRPSSEAEPSKLEFGYRLKLRPGAVENASHPFRVRFGNRDFTGSGSLTLDHSRLISNHAFRRGETAARRAARKIARVWSGATPLVINPS